GGELKPSLDIVVSAPTQTGQQYHAGPPVVQPPTISLGGTESRDDGALWPPREDRQHLAGPGSDGSGGSSGSDRRTGSDAAAAGRASTSGLSWQELAGSGRRSAESGPAPAGTETKAKPRRRRAGGIDQK
ncbi:MAG TPA: DUF4255 domain-containing protein, partial [Nakamurella multipartita]|nr:DUF4255 domain-containing protein [Nakamurella multipartita]